MTSGTRIISWVCSHAYLAPISISWPTAHKTFPNLVKPFQWLKCDYVKFHTFLPPSPVIVWVELDDKSKWLPSDSGYNDVMRQANNIIICRKIVTSGDHQWRHLNDSIDWCYLRHFAGMSAVSPSINCHGNCTGKKVWIVCLQWVLCTSGQLLHINQKLFRWDRSVKAFHTIHLAQLIITLENRHVVKKKK